MEVQFVGAVMYCFILSVVLTAALIVITSLVAWPIMKLLEKLVSTIESRRSHTNE